MSLILPKSFTDKPLPINESIFKYFEKDNSYFIYLLISYVNSVFLLSIFNPVVLLKLDRSLKL